MILLASHAQVKKAACLAILATWRSTMVTMTMVTMALYRDARNVAIQRTLPVASCHAEKNAAMAQMIPPALHAQLKKIACLAILAIWRNTTVTITMVTMAPY